jgi:UDP-glucose 4-epimerase
VQGDLIPQKLAATQDVAGRRIASAVVIGGAGFIGRHLVKQLVDEGVAVASVDRDPRGRFEGVPATSVQADTVSGDRTLAEHLSADHVHAVFVLVGTGFVPLSLANPQADLENNVFTVLAVLECLRARHDPPVVVYFSSSAVYGDAQEPPMREDGPTGPLSPYGVSKLAGESYIRLYHRLYGIPGLALRPFSVYGPGQHKLVIYDLLRRILAGEAPLAVRGDPSVNRDYVYVADVVRAASRLARVAPAQGEAYNVCTGHATSLGGLAAQLLSAAETEVAVEFTGHGRAGDPSQFVGDPGAALALGAGCTTSLHHGLRATVTWIRGNA